MKRKYLHPTSGITTTFDIWAKKMIEPIGSANTVFDHEWGSSPQQFKYTFNKKALYGKGGWMLELVERRHKAEWYKLRRSSAKSQSNMYRTYAICMK
jgi:hypothetical protein